MLPFVVFKQKTAYEMRISDWSSDVCSSDLRDIVREGAQPEDVTEEMVARHLYGPPDVPPIDLLIRTSGERRISNFMLWRAAYSELKFEIGRASCRERVCQYV